MIICSVPTDRWVNLPHGSPEYGVKASSTGREVFIVTAGRSSGVDCSRLAGIRSWYNVHAIACLLLHLVTLTPRGWEGGGVRDRSDGGRSTIAGLWCLWAMSATDDDNDSNQDYKKSSHHSTEDQSKAGITVPDCVQGLRCTQNNIYLIT